MFCWITVSDVRGETPCSAACNDLGTRDHAGVSCSQVSRGDAPKGRYGRDRVNYNDSKA